MTKKKGKKKGKSKKTVKVAGKGKKVCEFC